MFLIEWRQDFFIFENWYLLPIHKLLKDDLFNGDENKNVIFEGDRCNEI